MSSSGAAVVASGAGPSVGLSSVPALGPQTSTELRLIPSDAVILLYRLGEGEFGEVYCGKLHLENGQTQDVAVKVSLTTFFYRPVPVNFVCSLPQMRNRICASLLRPLLLFQVEFVNSS